MSNFINEHFERVTTAKAKDWMSYVDPINVFASSNAVRLGVNTSGDWIVEDPKGRHLFYQDIDAAILCYKEVVKSLS